MYINVIGIVLLTLVLCAVTVRMANVPVVYKAMNGTVCECLVDGDLPSKKQCDAVDFNDSYETVKVGGCK